MARNEIKTKALTEVNVDGRDAQVVLDELTAKANKYQKAMVEAQKANDKVSFDKAEREFKKYDQAAKAVKKSTADVNAVMKNLSGATMKELQAAQRKITAQLSGMTRGTAEYIAKSKQLQLVSAEIKKVKTEMTGVAATQSGLFGKMTNGFNKYFGIVAGAIAAVTGIGLGLRKLAEDAMVFENALADLSALTGLVGSDLSWLGEEAKRLSTSVTEDGVRITKSADEILEAFKLMGSAKPELLENKEALAEVTTQALKLAEAAKMDTKTAVESLANVMNQFGAEADQAGKFINVLAAGSKFGAAAVDSIAESVVKFGPAANSANISIEESVGLIEALAEKGVKGDIAGTQLRTALLKLQTGADQFNPKVVGLNRALENLNKENLSAGELVKIFGQEAYTAGAILIQNYERVNYFTDAVKDTNIATEQAIINTDTQSARLKQLRNELKLNGMELGQKLAPIMSGVTFTMSKFIRFLTVAIPWLERNWRTIVLISTAIAAYTVVLKANLIWTNLLTAAKWLATKAQLAFNVAVKANPLGLLITALTTVVTALVLFRKRADESKKAVKELSDAQQAFNDLIINNKSIEERFKILNTLSKRQLEILRDDINNQLHAEEDYTTLLLKELKKRIDNDIKIKNLEKQLDQQTIDYKKAWIQNLIKIRKGELAQDLETEYQNQKKRITNLNGYLSAVNKSIKNYRDELQESGKASYDEIEKSLTDTNQQIRLEIHKNYLNGKINKEEFDAQIQLAEMAHLEAMIALRKKYGEETLDLELKLTNEKIKLMESVKSANQKVLDDAIKANEVSDDQIITDSMKSTEEAIQAEVDAWKKANEEEIRLQKEKEAELKALREQGILDAINVTSELGANLLAAQIEMRGMSAENAEQAKKEMTIMALNALEQIANIAIAQIVAKELGSKSFAGIATAAILGGIVKAAVAAAKARVNQRASGKYDVVGADDGRTYRGVPLGGAPVTGIGTRPTLYFERGDELVVDNKTLRNVRVNFPDVIPKIQASRVPQKASGNVDQIPTNTTNAPQQNNDINIAIMAAINRLNNTLDYGIAASISYTENQKKIDKAQRIKSASNRGTSS